MKKIFSTIMLIFVLGTTTEHDISSKKIKENRSEVTKKLQKKSDQEKNSAKQSKEKDEVETMICKVTAYCPCEKCSGNWGRRTATGGLAIAGRTVAVDPKVIPYGSTVWIKGHKYIAEDCGGAVKGNIIDLYVNTHEETLRWGKPILTVKVKKAKRKE